MTAAKIQRLRAATITATRSEGRKSKILPIKEPTLVIRPVIPVKALITFVNKPSKPVITAPITAPTASRKSTIFSSKVSKIG